MLYLHQDLIYLFYLLSICTDQVFHTPKIIAFLPQSKLGSKKRELELNSILYPEWEYLSQSAFLVKLTAPKKQSFTVKSPFKSCDLLSKSINHSKSLKKHLPIKNLKSYVSDISVFFFSIASSSTSVKS